MDAYSPDKQSGRGTPAVLGSYETGDGHRRQLIGRRIEGEVNVYDTPADRCGRAYFVERGFQSKAELAVFVAHYRRHAARLGVCPMSREAIERAYVDCEPVAELVT
jgi:hypothetical protein